MAAILILQFVVALKSNRLAVTATWNSGCMFILIFTISFYQAMGRIFVGLCQVGAWGCFDEFNRLEERILSAVSQQVQTIQEALKEFSQEDGASCSVCSSPFSLLNLISSAWFGIISLRIIRTSVLCRLKYNVLFISNCFLYLYF